MPACGVRKTVIVGGHNKSACYWLSLLSLAIAVRAIGEVSVNVVVAGVKHINIKPVLLTLETLKRRQHLGLAP